MAVTELERLEAEVLGERGPLQEPGITWRNAHQARGVTEADGLGFGEILFSYFPPNFEFPPPVPLCSWISAVITENNINLIVTDFDLNVQVTEMEKELEPMREKLQSDRHSTKKYDEKVEEWKV